MPKPGSASDPLWYKDAIIYELHVKAFFDSTNDGIGDFQGLIQKLDYLRDLGVTCLWLLPFFPSPLRDDGYDIADYRNVHPSYGTLDDFRTFLAAAHDRGMQVMIELVINHTSDQHPWFQAARMAPPGSPERDFYVWSDTAQKYPGARIIFTDTEKSNWTWDAQAQAYFWHRFFSHQPDLNYDNPRVLEEVISIMHYWLDMGVDALRLDAIPYLVEREGTNCENLPETHAVIKSVRREMDAHSLNRMILAEANQWPSDVRSYFGDGDECHMAFHFPLMPRLFMGLRLEDRHPITEIMAQTPEIPDACQWALFLRNHDELTLEMVSDEERDYMYFAYSADPRMRLNIGIRRRLAAMMDNNRRRIELLNSILFSFRGTPVLYYGDEIGMGDNIYLGDRNGVRTPMQWSADRNGGFSRANPARLYSPVIMDPVYGYEAINVEAQQSDPSSLLHWMRNMIALRKLFKVFGRGSLEFLHPANRKILAYVRSSETEQVLCVANLSRFAQPVELDLSRFAGMSPVEMMGFVEFPEIHKTPYQLTLGPYGYFWFELQHSDRPLEFETPETEERTEDVLAGVSSWQSALTGPARGLIESDYLPKFLYRQRWFAGAARSVEQIVVEDWLLLDEVGAAILLAGVKYSDGGPESYIVPLKLAKGEESGWIADSNPDAMLTVWDTGSGERLIYDATFDEPFRQALLKLISEGPARAAREGTVRGLAGKELGSLYGTPDPPPASDRESATGSYTTLLYGDRVILKLLHRLEAGPHPDCELTRYLAEERGLASVPRFGGALEYQASDRPAGTLAILEELVKNEGDGWAWTAEDLGRYYEHCATLDIVPAMDSGAAQTEARQAIGIYLEAAATLARRTAEMHIALACETCEPDLRPEPMRQADLKSLAGRLEAHAAAAFEKLKRSLSSVPDEWMEIAGQVLTRKRRLLDHFLALEKLPVACLNIRIHGDYHLAQVLRVKNDFVILNFGGDPALPLAERRAKGSPLRDVANMLRSLSQAAQSAYLNHIARRPHDATKLAPWTQLWEQTNCTKFLDTYREAVASHDVLPADPAHFEILLDAFLFDQALTELEYDLDNRPAWLRIPLSGILALDGKERR